MPKLSFHGADRGVTGSCHLIECGAHRVLIDCGFYQGGDEPDQGNARPFGFDPATIDFVLLTHAHLDHCGRLPLLVRRGFHGEMITTDASRELARLVMLDAANLQEEEARSESRSAGRQGAEPTVPLYSVLDAVNTVGYFGRTAAYDEPMEVCPGVEATFLDAGHILGSASILLQLTESERRVRVLFSGDLGNAGQPLLRMPAKPPAADAVVMETTYGDRLHKPIQASVEELYAAISDTFSRGGNVVIPTFALERAQAILYFLREGLKRNRLPRTMQVFLDSPMAISATEIFRHHPECYDKATAALFQAGNDPLSFSGLHLARETADSKALNGIAAGAVIMAGSGMCTGGRVQHHLKHNLWRSESSVVFVGYAAQHTLARQIIDGAKRVQILGEDIPVRAHVHTINGFSAHADQAELLAWHRQTDAGRTFLVHGEERTMRQFASLLKKTGVEMPVLHQQFDL